MLLTLRTPALRAQGRSVRRAGPPAARGQTAARLRGPRLHAGSRPAPPQAEYRQSGRNPGRPSRGTAPSLAPAFLPCALPGHLLLWKAHPCIQAAVCGGDGPAFLSAPTAPHPLRASAQLWTRVPATRAGEEVPLNPWQQLFRPGTDCLSVSPEHRTEGAQEDPPGPRVSPWLRLRPQLVGLSHEGSTCPAHILWLLRTRSSASIPGTPVETHCHSLNKSFWASTMYDALRSRDPCNEDLALLV